MIDTMHSAFQGLATSRLKTLDREKCVATTCVETICSPVQTEDAWEYATIGAGCKNVRESTSGCSEAWHAQCT